jgi:hypothetical protein
MTSISIYLRTDDDVDKQYNDLIRTNKADLKFFNVHDANFLEIVLSLNGNGWSLKKEMGIMLIEINQRRVSPIVRVSSSLQFIHCPSVNSPFYRPSKVENVN